jgi:class 3 adenylate cyclase
VGQDPGAASAELGTARLPRFIFFPVVRWLAVIVTVMVSLAGLASAAFYLEPWLAGGHVPSTSPSLAGRAPQLSGWLPESARLGSGGGAAVIELIVLGGAVLAGMVMLAGVRRLEARARARRYRTWLRDREDAQREQALVTSRAEPERVDAPEAVLVLDLVQSTELIREQGDAFFRDLLRRIETAFIPVARRHGSRAVDGHGDGFLFCFERAAQALEAVREMYARLPALNAAMPSGVEIAFRASLHLGPTFPDTRGNRAGLTVLKTVRLGSVMETLHCRGAFRNSLVISEEARVALGPAAEPVKLLGNLPLRGFPGTHPVYQLEV